jgi:hypothetical protein
MNQLRSLGLLLLALPLAAGCGDNNQVGDDDGGADASIDPTPDAAPPDAPPPPPPGVTLFDFLIAVDVTPDGTTAVFEDITSTAATAHLHDTVTGETTVGPLIGDPSRSLATSISADGKITAFHNEPAEAGVWTPGSGWLELGSPHAAGCGADELSSAWDISADGLVVVGMAWDGCAPDAFVWTAAGGFTSLDRIGASAPGSPNPPSNRATVVSDDGAVIAGFAQNGPVDRSPAVWAADGTGFLLDPTQMDAPGEVLSISAGGQTLAGVWGYDGFVWTSEGGVVMIPRLDISLPSDPIYPNAIAADGRLVFGGIGSAFFTVPTAFVWSADAGTRALADIATAAGVTLPEGTLLTSVLAASADGTVLIGTAFDVDFNPKTFALRLPATAYDIR